MTFYLQRTRSSNDRTCSFNGSTLVTLQSYKDPQIGMGTEPKGNPHPQTKYVRYVRFTRTFGLSDTLRSLSINSREQDNQRRYVLFRDTSVVLVLNFTPGPSHAVVFDALEILLSHSINYTVGPGSRRLLSLQILLVDDATYAFVRVGEWDQEQGDEQASEQPRVDFQADHDIVDLRDGKVIARLALPCCSLDHTHRTDCHW